MIYLANPSFQNHHFHFREPVNGLVNVIEIERGGQQGPIGHGWTTEQQRKVIEQLERYGARNASDVHGKLTRFSGLLYSDVRIISEDEILAGHEAELETRGERSAMAATKGALAFDRTARTRTRERPSAMATKVEVRQDIMPGSRPTGNEVEFDIEVTPEGRSDVRLPV
jgi:hypothetical protein